MGELHRQIDLLRRAVEVPVPDDDTDFTPQKARRGAESWRKLARNTIAAYDAAALVSSGVSGGGDQGSNRKGDLPTEQADEAVVVLQTPRGPIDVDASIAPLVAALNASGAETIASCSGHGHRPGNIALRDGREIIIARDFDEARLIDRLFPVSSSGEQPPGPESALAPSAPDGLSSALGVRAGEDPQAARQQAPISAGEGVLEDAGQSLYAAGYRDGYTDAIDPEAQLEPDDVLSGVDSIAIQDGWLAERDGFLAAISTDTQLGTKGEARSETQPSHEERERVIEAARTVALDAWTDRFVRLHDSDAVHALDRALKAYDAASSNGGQDQ